LRKIKRLAADFLPFAFFAPAREPDASVRPK
jgi:hypothetical protein